MPGLYSLIGSIALTDSGATATVRKVKSEVNSLHQTLAAGQRSGTNSLFSALTGGGGLTSVRGVEKALVDFGVAAGKASLAVAGVIGSIKLIGTSIQTYIPYQQARTFFEEFFGPDVVGNVNRLREASLGTVDDLNLMLASNRAFLLGVVNDVDSLQQLMSVAAGRARAMGVSTQSAFADLLLGIGRESKRILDNIGIVLDLEKALDRYAVTVGKTANQLDELERKQAIIADIFRQSQDLIPQDLGVEALSVIIERRTAAISNFKAQFGALFEPAATAINRTVADVVGGMAEQLEKFNARKAIRELDDFEQRLRNAKEAADSVRFSVQEYLRMTGTTQAPPESQFAIAKADEEVEKARMQLEQNRQAVLQYYETYLSMMEALAARRKKLEDEGKTQTVEYWETRLKYQELSQRLDQDRQDSVTAGFIAEAEAKVAQAAIEAANATDVAAESVQKMEYAFRAASTSAEGLQDDLDKLSAKAQGVARSFAIAAAEINGSFDNFGKYQKQAEDLFDELGKGFVDRAFNAGEAPNADELETYQRIQQNIFDDIIRNAKEVEKLDPSALDEYWAGVFEGLQKAENAANVHRQQGNPLEPLDFLGMQQRFTVDPSNLVDNLQEVSDATRKWQDQLDPGQLADWAIAMADQETVLGKFQAALARADMSQFISQMTASDEVGKAMTDTAGRLANRIAGISGAGAGIRALAEIRSQLDGAATAYQAYVDERNKAWDPDEFALFVAPVIDQWETYASDLKSSLKDSNDALRSHAQIVKDVMKELGSIIDGAIQPTTEGLIDIEEILGYQDAVDEPARRMADVAANGFKSEWLGNLKDLGLIPQEVLDAGEGELRKFAARMVQIHEQGLSPALYDEETIKQRVREQFAGRVAMEGFKEKIKADLLAEGLDISASDISSALGEGAIGTAFADSFVGQVAAGNPTGRVVNALKTAILEQRQDYIDLGKSGGAWVTEGIISEIKAGLPQETYNTLAQNLLPIIIRALIDQQDRTGG